MRHVGHLVLGISANEGRQAAKAFMRMLLSALRYVRRCRSRQEGVSGFLVLHEAVGALAHFFAFMIVAGWLEGEISVNNVVGSKTDGRARAVSLRGASDCICMHFPYAIWK